MRQSGRGHELTRWRKGQFWFGVVFEDDAASVVITMIEECKCGSPIIWKVKCAAGWMSVSAESLEREREGKKKAPLPAFSFLVHLPGKSVLRNKYLLCKSSKWSHAPSTVGGNISVAGKLATVALFANDATALRIILPVSLFRLNPDHHRVCVPEHSRSV